MKLNLKQVLALAQIAKPKFDSGRRRELYGFMRDARFGEGSAPDYENARARYGLEHVTGLLCIDQGVKTGVSVEMANSIVANNFGLIAMAVEDGTIDPSLDLDAYSLESDGHLYAAAVFNRNGRAHVFDRVASLNARAAEYNVKVATGQYHDDFSVIGIVAMDATVAYRTARSRVLDGLGLA